MTREAESVILSLLATLLGNDKQGAGLLVLRRGQYHTPRCQATLWVTAGDSLRGGQPCSDRCKQSRAARAAAARWLQAAEHLDEIDAEQPTQLQLLEIPA